MKSYIGCAYVITRSDVWLRSPGVWRDNPQTRIGAGTSDVFGGSLTSHVTEGLIVDLLNQMYQLIPILISMRDFPLKLNNINI